MTVKKALLLGDPYDKFSDGFSELLQHEIHHLREVVAMDHLQGLESIAMRSEWEKRYSSRL
ncbi:hypothetical protein ISS40_02500 [Candidatus Bathyarchaeota archaeon]|nr:hypothetical protein [Candidatus Bathyarchaeota archaeon]MBL7167520.1 hypothetical protein [Candidatus Bathyarchaeota archaeon]